MKVYVNPTLVLLLAINSGGPIDNDLLHGHALTQILLMLLIGTKPLIINFVADLPHLLDLFLPDILDPLLHMVGHGVYRHTVLGFEAFNRILVDVLNLHKFNFREWVDGDVRPVDFEDAQLVPDGFGADEDEHAASVLEGLCADPVR